LTFRAHAETGIRVCNRISLNRHRLTRTGQAVVVQGRAMRGMRGADCWIDVGGVAVPGGSQQAGDWKTSWPATVPRFPVSGIDLADEKYPVVGREVGAV
jgi:hypothetical protein